MFQDVCDNSNKIGDDDCLLDFKCNNKDVGLSSFRWYKREYSCHTRVFTVNKYTVKDSFSILNEIRNSTLAYIWLHLTSTVYSSKYHWIRQMEFVWNCYFIK